MSYLSWQVTTEECEHRTQLSLVAGRTKAGRTTGAMAANTTTAGISGTLATLTSALENITTEFVNTTTPTTSTSTVAFDETTATTTTTTVIGEEVFFTLGKFDFTAETPISQWLAVFLVPTVYLTILLVAIIVDMTTCARLCARLRHGRHVDSLDTSAVVGHRESMRQRKLKKRLSETHKHKDAQAAKTAAQKAYVFELVKEGTVFLGPKTMFLMHKRKFKNFSPAEMAKLPEPKNELSVQYDSTRKGLYCTFMNTVFATALRPSVIITCIAGLWSWGVYAFRSMVSDDALAYIDADRETDNSFSLEVQVNFNSSVEENIAYFLQNLDRMASLTALVQSYMSFMLVFYALQSLVLWNRTYAQMRGLGVQFEKMALFFGSLNRDDDEQCRRVKFKVYRYLNLLHFFMYASNVEFLMSDFKNILTRQLVRVGLMEQREKEIIDDSMFPLAAINSWITAIYWNRSTWLAPRTARLRLLRDLTELNNRYTTLSVTINSNPPYSWAQLMRLLVDVYMLLTPFAFVSDMYMPTSEAQIWPVVGTFVVSMFLQGLMAFVRFLKTPFGNSRDAFNPDACLLDVERKMLFHLSHHNDDPVYDPNSPEIRYRAIARAQAELAKKKKLEAEENPVVFFGSDD